MAFEEMSCSTGQQGASSHLQPSAAQRQRPPCCGAREPVGSTLPYKGQPEDGSLLGVLSREGTVLWVER